MFKRFFCTVMTSALFAVFAASGVQAETDERENFHRDGDWGYTVLGDNTAAVSGYFGTDKDVAIPTQLGGYTVTAVGGGWYIENGEPVLYGNVHNIAYGEDGGVAESKVYSPFSGNTEIESVTMPSTVTSVGAISFKNCTSLKTVVFGQNVRLLGNNCFEGCTSLISLDVPDSVTFIDQELCLNCASLTNVTFGQNSRCGISAFEGCTSLQCIEIPESWGTIPADCFSGCTALSEVSVADGITGIEDSAFFGCTSLTEIDLPDSVTAIYNNAFNSCTSLEYANVGSSLDTLGSRAFADSGLKTLELPDTLVRIGECAFGMSSDGTAISDFILNCSRYSAAESYALENGIACSSVNADTDMDSVSSRGTALINSEKTFTVLLIALAAAAVTIIVLIVLTLKNRGIPDSEDENECIDKEPETDELFDDEQKSEDGRFETADTDDDDPVENSEDLPDEEPDSTDSEDVLNDDIPRENVGDIGESAAESSDEEIE